MNVKNLHNKPSMRENIKTPQTSSPLAVDATPNTAPNTPQESVMNDAMQQNINSSMTSRVIKKQLFSKASFCTHDESSTSHTPSAPYFSLSDLKEILSRLDQMQHEIESCNNKTHTMYLRLVDWLNRMKDKIDQSHKTQQEWKSSIEDMLSQWKKQFLTFKSQASNTENQRRMSDLMHRHSQFIQGYGKSLDTLKKAISRNEYHIAGLMGDVKTFRLELDFIKNNIASKNSNRTHKASGYPVFSSEDFHSLEDEARSKVDPAPSML